MKFHIHPTGEPEGYEYKILEERAKRQKEEKASSKSSCCCWSSIFCCGAGRSPITLEDIALSVVNFTGIRPPPPPPPIKR